MTLYYLIKYLAFTVTEGDYLNDYLTHLPHTWNETVMTLGQLVALLT